MLCNSVLTPHSHNQSSTLLSVNNTIYVVTMALFQCFHRLYLLNLAQTRRTRDRRRALPAPVLLRRVLARRSNGAAYACVCRGSVLTAAGSARMCCGGNSAGLSGLGLSTRGVALSAARRARPPPGAMRPAAPRQDSPSESPKEH